jgi:hypothetical protein
MMQPTSETLRIARPFFSPPSLPPLPQPAKTLRMLPPSVAPADHHHADAHHDDAHDDDHHQHHHVYGHIYDARWISHGLDYLKNEALLFLRTLWGFSIRPRETAARWMAGDVRLLHPLNFLIKTLAISTAAKGLWWSRFGLPKPTIANTIGDTIGPYLYVAILGVIIHFGFRRSGSKQPLASSLAGLLFALGAGPTLLEVFGDPIQHATAATWRTVSALGFPYLAAGFKPFVLSILHLTTKFGLIGGHILYLGFTLSGIHGTSRRRGAVIAFVSLIAFIVFLFAVLIAVIFAYVFVRKVLLAH